MSGLYTQRWDSRTPGFVGFICDCSGSMESPYGQAQQGTGAQDTSRKCDAVSSIINSFLNTLVDLNLSIDTSGQPFVRPCAHVAAWGYWEGTVASLLPNDQEVVPLDVLYEKPRRMETRKKSDGAPVFDGDGNIVDGSGEEEDVRIWVEPYAEGRTPMMKALHHALSVAREQSLKYPDSFPPLLIHVTDGLPTDCPFDALPGMCKKIAQEVSSIQTSNGTALLFTAHLTSSQTAIPVYYPASVDELPYDPKDESVRFSAECLYELSSVIPEPCLKALTSTTGRQLGYGTRGLVGNGSPNSITTMIHFSSAPALGYPSWFDCTK